MKIGRIVVLAVALIAAVGAALLMNQAMSGKKATKVIAKPVNTQKVLVAKSAISFGTKLSADKFSWVDWPKKSSTQKGYIVRGQGKNADKKYIGAIARADFLPGEPLRMDKIVMAGQGGVLAAVLAPGKRAVSVRIKENTAAGNFILPNDRVDVILTMTNSTTKKRVSKTILSNVRVLAIGHADVEKKGKKTLVGNTATVELSIGQAESLSAAESSGTISLALRALRKSPLDKDVNIRKRTGVIINSFGQNQALR